MTLPSSLPCEVCGTFSQANASLCLFCNRPLFSFIPQTTTSLFLDGLFHDRYQVLAKIGAGGFGAVYKALDTQNQGHLVAIKEVKIGQLEGDYAKLLATWIKAHSQDDDKIVYSWIQSDRKVIHPLS